MWGKVYQDQDWLVLLCQSVKESIYCVFVPYLNACTCCTVCVCFVYVCNHVVGECVEHSLARMHTWASLFLRVCSDVWHFLRVSVRLHGNWTRCLPVTVSVCGTRLWVQTVYTSKLCLSGGLTYVHAAAMKERLCSRGLPITPQLVEGEERMSRAP